MMDMMVHHERARWLAPHAVDVRPGVIPWDKRLLDLPTSAADLFQGGGDTLLQVVAEKKLQLQSVPSGGDTRTRFFCKLCL